jgi:hypothetical protein
MVLVSLVLVVFPLYFNLVAWAADSPYCPSMGDPDEAVTNFLNVKAVEANRDEPFDGREL